MARSGTCRKCGARIRPSAKDMSVGAASRIHYWKHHREVMLGGKKKKASGKASGKKAVARKTRSR